jgi:hypothetical protein
MTIRIFTLRKKTSSFSGAIFMMASLFRSQTSTTPAPPPARIKTQIAA